MLNFRISNAKLTQVLGFTPSRTVLESTGEILRKLPLDKIADYGDPRCYNIRLMTVVEEVYAEQRCFDAITKESYCPTEREPYSSQTHRVAGCRQTAVLNILFKF